MKFILKKLENSINVSGIANVHFFEFPKSFHTENDRHPFYELLFVAGGRLKINSEEYSGFIQKNQMIIHRANEYHSLKCPETTMPTVIIIGFDCASGDLSPFAKSPVSLTDTEVKKLAEIVKEGRNVFAPPYDVPVYDMKKKKNAPFGAEQMLKNLLEYFLISLTRKFLDAQETEDLSLFGGLSIAEVVSYIDDNYKEKITLDELAFIFRTNRSTLCKEFKSSTGKTVSEYVASKKLESAKRKILSTDKTFTEIAEELNFESIHYFTRFFKKQTGVSPKEYRKTR
jgi:AraC-like DNA-binding protein